jgi:phage terminase large subunit
MATVDFSRLNECINEVYYPLLWDYKRFNVLRGGAGAGKSVFASERYIYRFITERGRNLLGIRKVDKDNRDSIYAQLNQVISMWGLGDLFRCTLSPLSITCLVNRNQVLFRGLNDPESLKSITFINGPLTDVWVEEANQITEEEDMALNLRLRGYTAIPKQTLYTFNPISALHWIKPHFFDRPMPEEKCTVLTTTYRDNAWLDEADKAYIESLKEQNPDYYAVYALAQWGTIGDLVFSDYVIEDFVYDWGDFDAIYPGLDFGFKHASALELVGVKDDEIYIFDEIYKRGLTNSELIAETVDYFTLKRRIDSLRKTLIIADSAEPARIKEWHDSGFRIEGARKGPDSVRYSIDNLKSRRIHIHRSNCPGIAAEIPNYAYRKDKNGEVMEEPVAFHDDGIAALRYAMEPTYMKMDIKKLLAYNSL